MNFSRSITASVEIQHLIELGWELDQEEGYQIDITVDENGKTKYCYTNKEKLRNGIWEGSDNEDTGDDIQTIKDLKRLQKEGKLFDVKEAI